MISTTKATKITKQAFFVSFVRFVVVFLILKRACRVRNATYSPIHDNVSA